VPCSPDAPDASHLVGCGGPLPGHALRVVEDHGKPVGDRVVGETLVSGPSVTQGYLSGPDAADLVVTDPAQAGVMAVAETAKFDLLRQLKRRY
jgi:uncharacterized protein with ACT and thioredoxin-like domain